MACSHINRYSSNFVARWCGVCIRIAKVVTDGFESHASLNFASFVTGVRDIRGKITVFD